jgi:hypothetical protein
MSVAGVVVSGSRARVRPPPANSKLLAKPHHKRDRPEGVQESSGARIQPVGFSLPTIHNSLDRAGDRAGAPRLGTPVGGSARSAVPGALPLAVEAAVFLRDLVEPRVLERVFLHAEVVEPLGEELDVPRAWWNDSRAVAASPCSRAAIPIDGKATASRFPPTRRRLGVVRVGGHYQRLARRLLRTTLE